MNVTMPGILCKSIHHLVFVQRGRLSGAAMVIRIAPVMVIVVIGDSYGQVTGYCHQRLATLDPE